MSKNSAVLGIDLGTTNSAISVSNDIDSVVALPIFQASAPGSVVEDDLLPSMLYIPFSEEFPDDAFKMPWHQDAPKAVVGTFAKKHGAENPERLVHSAKSWLSNHHIDRTADILPWNSKIAQDKWSPLQASKMYLEHLRQAAFLAHPELASQSFQSVLTVPASFDDTARSLTHEAASSAGFEDVSILEEPIAAFYAWIESHQDSWRDLVSPGDLVLVCDIGGGTADFSLISVSENSLGELDLVRVSVGDHILLGGDNIDLAIAQHLRSKLADQNVKLDQWQFISMVHAARNAKEVLLSEDGPSEYPISVASKGSSLFSSAISTTLSTDEIKNIVVEGFFPEVACDESPRDKTSVGLRQFGLNYASDAAFTKHLAKFLRDSYETVASRQELSEIVSAQVKDSSLGLLRPTAILFNGGVCKASGIRERVSSLLRKWCDQDVRELPGSDYDRAVSRGAAYYGRLRQSDETLKIRSGTPFAYYIAVESSAPAIPGMEPELQGVCVVPQGMEEGSTYLLEREFGLLTGQDVEFQFFRSSTSGDDEVGSIVSDIQGSKLRETSRLHLKVPNVSEKQAEIIPVRLRSVVTDVGTLELWMEHLNSDNRWKLEFSVRGDDSQVNLVANATGEQQQLAFDQIDTYYQKKN